MKSLLDYLECHARATPERPAITRRRVDGKYETTTWRQLRAQNAAFAAAFSGRLKPGQIVPLCMGKTATCVAAMLGALEAGCAFSILNQKLRAPQVAHILQATQAPLAVIDEAGLMALKGAVSETSAITEVEWWVAKGTSFAGMQQRIADELAGKTKVGIWPEVDRHGNARGAMQPAASAGEGPSCCLFTSGSTGTPKGVLISGGDLLARAEAEVEWYELSSKDVLLSILPFSFDVGLNQLLTAIITGCELVICDSWLPRDIMKTAAERVVTGISSVPSIWLDFLTHGLAFDSTTHQGLRYITVSGGDLSVHHLEKLPGIARHSGIYKTYGQTEAFRATSLKPGEFAAHPTSVGQPFIGVHLYIMREDGTQALPGEPGEVVHTGLGVMAGYLGGNDPQNKLRANPFQSACDANKQAIFTGDTGYVNTEGYLFLCGRRDDMLKIQGNRVYPAEIRDQMLGIDGIAQVEIVPVKIKDQTQLAAFVIPQAGVAFTPAAIRMAMAARAPSYMVPDAVFIKEAFPRTASGKPDRQALAAEAAGIPQATA